MSSITNFEDSLEGWKLNFRKEFAQTKLLSKFDPFGILCDGTKVSETYIPTEEISCQKGLIPSILNRRDWDETLRDFERVSGFNNQRNAVHAFHLTHPDDTYSSTRQNFRNFLIERLNYLGSNAVTVTKEIMGVDEAQVLLNFEAVHKAVAQYINEECFNGVMSYQSILAAGFIGKITVFATHDLQSERQMTKLLKTYGVDNMFMRLLTQFISSKKDELLSIVDNINQETASTSFGWIQNPEQKTHEIASACVVILSSFSVTQELMKRAAKMPATRSLKSILDEYGAQKNSVELSDDVKESCYDEDDVELSSICSCGFTNMDGDAANHQEKYPEHLMRRYSAITFFGNGIVPNELTSDDLTTSQIHTCEVHDDSSSFGFVIDEDIGSIQWVGLQRKGTIKWSMPRGGELYSLEHEVIHIIEIFSDGATQQNTLIFDASVKVVPHWCNNIGDKAWEVIQRNIDSGRFIIDLVKDENRELFQIGDMLDRENCYDMWAEISQRHKRKKWKGDESNACTEVGCAKMFDAKKQKKDRMHHLLTEHVTSFNRYLCLRCFSGGKTSFSSKHKKHCK